MDINDFLPNSTKELLFNKSAKKFGDAVGELAELALFPLNVANAYLAPRAEKFVKSIRCKAEEIPEEERDSSKFGLTLKAIEDAKYQLDDADLRDMFEKIILKSLDKKYNQNLSPRFSSILMQLSSSDANLLKELSFNPVLPVPTVLYGFDEGKNIYPILDHFIGINYSANHIVHNESGLNTLESLGLIQVKDNFEIQEDHIQNFYKQMKYSEYPVKSVDGKGERDLRIMNGIIKFTSFGKSLINIVI